MISGNASVLAIESGITQAYERSSFRALGFFVIHVGGRRYGVYEPDATLLANSFDEVERRLVGRGGHTASFASLDAGKIADAFRSAIYAEKQETSYFGVSLSEFCEILYSKHIIWAPDGDAAFDDGSYVLQFDVRDRVRLIAFKCGPDCLHDPATLSDVWLASDDFYCVLQQWHDGFKSEWASMPRSLS